MYVPDQIIDSHIHLLTAKTNAVRLENQSRLEPHLLQAYHERWQESLSSRREQGPEANPSDVATVARRWEKELDRGGIERAVFFTSDEAPDELAEFVSFNPARFYGYSTFDPTSETAAAVLSTQIEEHGIKGVKLYPMKRYFHIDDPRCFRVYEICQINEIPILIHFGLSISATHDLQYGNPLDLAGPALRFSSLKWIIPHFGTGFFRELLLLAAQYKNVCIDTSSSNNWIRHSPYPLTLEHVFRKAYETVGSKRIFFGTDSSFFPRGFRKNILEEQLEIWNDLGLAREEIDHIFYENIKETLHP